ncbi:HD-GYP domain-containing protein (c-di-GMP phosphodiesterase class II) [Paenibacillus taihuensis]|uniref:HD-GYP domain-containing protein (C-di-GMP phosphodiesterase class II) n=1 Tax=Paenibacillus taihuensis TaxID=1156355 RepID=A0A3D9S1Z1_9BACL|nr:HD-GYP domain-containing protein [Paenibacillus taihuensis]REE82662.1 HD-GYP domain-containing protein (c-di-GMP phosphodiesterase class II) [Paenibacillus taihuensis]
MRLLPIQMCRPGMRLAKKIYSEDGVVLLSENVELSARLINRLSECGVYFVYIQDPRLADLVIPDLISEDTRQRALSEIRTNFRDLMDRPNRKSGVTYPYIAKSFKQIMGMVIDDLTDQKDAMIMLMNMGIVDDYLFQHSLNVSVYTTLLGIANGYNRDELMTLGLGAMLHDIGKTQISPNILKKQGSLTFEEYEEMKRHAERGYLLLKDEPNIPLIAAHCAYQHHERLDGSGYPRGIKGDEIHEYAKWIGLVDSYDAMTTTRIYRRPMLPHEAVESLYAGTGTLYEQRMLQLFRDKVAIYPLGITVKLQSGEFGVVVDINSSCPHRPVVRVLNNENGEELNAPYEVDLSTQLTTMIVGVNDDPHLPEASGT